MQPVLFTPSIIVLFINCAQKTLKSTPAVRIVFNLTGPRSLRVSRRQKGTCDEYDRLYTR